MKKSQTKKPSKDSALNSQPSVDFTILGSLLKAPSPEAVEDLLESDSIWETEPVDLETFLYGEYYLNLSMRLSKPQIEFVENTSNIFNPPFFTESVLMAGQGSGKDTCSILIGLRIVYLLNCLKSPQIYFGMDSNSFIDSINVAQNADIARNIYFSTLSNILRSAPLFTPGNYPYYIPARITQQMVTFPKNIRLISGNSENESWQGYTPILIILDEIDAFKSEQEMQRSRSLRSEGAEGVYNTAKALVQSRFPSVGKIICLSWPRFKGSFIQRRFTNGKMEDRTFVSCKEGGLPFSTWEFNPSKKQSDFADFYATDPILARARFECDPPFARDAYIKDSLPILRAFDADIDEVGQITWSRLKEIREESGLQPGIKYYIHVDLGLRHANAALAIAHQGEEHIIVDLIKVWKAQPEVDIDFSVIENFILALRDKGFRVVSVTYDNYQSISSLQTLAKFGISAKYKSIGRSSREAYDTFKDLLYQEKLDGYFDKETIEEILGLDVVYGDKIEARPGMNKDRADAVVGAVHGVLKEHGTLTSMRNMGGINSLFENPSNPQQAQNEKARNPLKTPTNTGWGRDAVQERIVSSSSDICVVCNRIGGIEYTDELQNRVFDNDEAYWRMCLVCASKWEKQGSEWVISRPPDEYSMREVIGTL